MDKAWVDFKRNTIEYREGVKKFLKFAKEETGDPNLRCPCVKCQNQNRGSDNLVEEHLVINGMDLTYTIWVWHGESFDVDKFGASTSDTYQLREDSYDEDNHDAYDEDSSDHRSSSEDYSDNDSNNGESSDEEFSDMDVHAQEYSDRSASGEDSSEEEDTVPNSLGKRIKSSKGKAKGARMKGLSNRDAHEDARDYRELISPDGSNEENPSTKESHKSQNTRGPTNPSPVLDSSNRKKLMFNENGHPIGENSILFSSDLCGIAKEMVPLTYDDWRSVPKGLKNIFWEIIQKKYIMNEALGKDYSLQSIGKLWRAHKSRLRSKIRACKNKEHVNAIKPKCVVPRDWAYFVKKLSSKSFKRRSRKFKEMRAKQDLPHTCSRRGYARIEEQMKKECPNPYSITRTDVWMKCHTKENNTRNQGIDIHKFLSHVYNG